MALSRKTVNDLLDRGYSRRQIAKISLGAAAAVPFFNEFAQAQQSEDQANGVTRGGGRGARGGSGGGRGGRGGFGGGGGRGPYDPEVIRISSNENPMGPSKEGLEALVKVAPLGWRYSPQGENLDFEAELIKSENVKPGYAIGYPGSSIPLANSFPAFTSPTRPWVMGDPGYGGGGGRWVGNKVLHVPLRKDYTHDVEAMIKADPNAGDYYICNPNNPTATLTPMKDFEYLLANKPKDAVLVIDEAYVHFAGPEHYSTELVRQDKDVIVLRTFSKAYGMAGLRMGATFGRPDLIAKIREYGGSGMLPVTATACAAASMKANPGLMAERKELNKQNRELALEHIQKMGQSYIGTPVANFFMLSVKGMTGAQVGAAFSAKKIQLAGANRWPSMPQHIRVTVGTKEEMTKFNAVLDQVIQEGPPKAVAQAG
jgi:histidinol-phosphate/aromatic aminotransferase/cobyric acid decarboxylase-like protein